MRLFKLQYTTVIRVANPSGMGGRLPEFISISRLPPDAAREMLISRPGDANLPECTELGVISWQHLELLKRWNIGIVNKMVYDTLI